MVRSSLAAAARAAEIDADEAMPLLSAVKKEPRLPENDLRFDPNPDPWREWRFEQVSAASRSTARRCQQSVNEAGAGAPVRQQEEEVRDPDDAVAIKVGRVTGVGTPGGQQQ